jgi:hypothetical protein
VARSRRTTASRSTGDYRHDAARSEIHSPDDLFDQLTGRVSLLFESGDHRRIAVTVIDQRGNEVMRVVGGVMVSSRHWVISMVKCVPMTGQAPGIRCFHDDQ